MERLRTIRKSKNLYQKDIAEYLGINRTTYVKYETGASEPDLHTVSKLADYFGVTVDYLLGREEPKEELISPPLDGSPTKQAILDRLDLLSDDQLNAVLAFITVLQDHLG